MPPGSLMIASLAVAVHTLSMLAVTGIMAIVVYDWVGLAFLRRLDQSRRALDCRADPRRVSAASAGLKI
jgi:hypothetical protein